MNKTILISLLALMAATAFGFPPGDAKIETAFGSNCERLLIDSFEKAEKEILVACYSFSRGQIADVLIVKANDGVRVRIKVDQRQATSKFCESTVAALQDSKVELELIAMPSKRSMHHKFAVIDGRWTVTGSYNFTHAATFDNWENLLQIDSQVIAREYSDEWERIKFKKRAKRKKHQR